MPKRFQSKSPNLQKIALARIDFLLNDAKKKFKENKQISSKYVKIARRIAMKYKVKFNKEQKKMFCKNCYNFLMPSVNSRVRIHKHRVIYYCYECREYMRHPVK